MKKKLNLAFLLSLLSLTIFGQASDFNDKPWTKEIYPIIIDPYQSNEIDFDKIITDKRVIGILHKASQGFNADKKYIERSEKSREYNILYGSYHLGTNEDPINQADFYLTTIKEHINEPMALDIEDIGGNNISLSDAEKFIKRIYEKTNKYPFVYVNNKVFNEINSKYNKNSVFAKCPLWYARFVTTLPKLNKNVWDKVTIWQFSCEINCCKCKCEDNKCIEKNGKKAYTKEYNPDCVSGNKSECAGDDKIHYCCPYKIKGTDCDIDINAFNGTFDELKSFWTTSNNQNNSSLDNFIKQHFKNSVRYNKVQIGKNQEFECGYSEVYFVEGFNADGELKERNMVYKKAGKYIISNDFIKWCSEQINFYSLNEFADLIDEQSKLKALNLMEMSFDSVTEFNIGFHSKIPENNEQNIDRYVTFKLSNDVLSYGFPTKKECGK